MSSHIGSPNRKLTGAFTRLSQQANYDVRIIAISVIGSDKKIHKAQLELGVDYSEATLDLIKQVRSKLAVEFKSLTDEELLVSGVFLTARKKRN
jgi:hypothetical protein